MRNKRFIAISMILVSVLACVIPGASQSAPIDQNSLSTVIVQTVNAATTQTAAAVGLAPAESPAPTLPAVNETSLEKLPDGSVKFTHISGGYEMTFPVGWLTLRPNSEEFNTALKDAAKNELLLNQMNFDINAYEAGFDQLYSYPLRPDIEKNTLFGFSFIGWEAEDTHPMNENSMGELLRKLETSSAIPGFRMDTAQVYETINQVKVIEIGGQFSKTDSEGWVVPFYSTLVYFKPTADTLVSMNFTYLKDFKYKIQVDVNFVISSVELLGQ
ncbi:MAG: hypothetical protein JNM02_04580 [Anaerolineales bacterium]|nr:hypothetical protein [Anaerolineales bacterium]